MEEIGLESQTYQNEKNQHRQFSPQQIAISRRPYVGLQPTVLLFIYNLVIAVVVVAIVVSLLHHGQRNHGSA